MARIFALSAVLFSLFWVGAAFATQDVLSLSDFCNGEDMGDDTACIREWIDKTQVTGSKDLYVPPGTYFYSSSVPLHSGIHIRCAGPGIAVFRNNGGVAGNFFFTNTAIKDVIVENCGFDVNGGVAEFLSVIGANATDGPNKNIRIRGNRIYDSAILGGRSAQQRQYILFLPCEECWIEDNHLSEGGRIKIGRPGKRLFIRNNIIDKVNDNAITTAQTGNATSSEIHIEDNVIRDPLGSGIHFSADGERQTDPMLTTLNVHVSRNIVTGDWGSFCIVGILPANAGKVHVVNNICTKTGTRGRFSAGILIKRVNGTDIPLAKDVLIGFNTVAGAAGGILPNGGIFISGSQKGIRVIGNHVRDIGSLAIRLRVGDLEDVVVSNNILTGGAILIGQAGAPDNFSGLIHGNIIVDSPASGMVLFAEAGDTITASIKDNVIKNPLRECIVFTGPGTYQVDLLENQLVGCGGAAPINFARGASLASGSVRIHNKGDRDPHAVPKRHLTAKERWDPRRMGPGRSEGKDVTIAGARPGDVATAGFDGIASGDWQISAHVVATDLVRVVITNHNRRPQDLPVGTLRVNVWKFE